MSGYDSELLPFSMSNQREIDLRSPGFWLSGIKSPTFVIEGTGGNASCVRNMAATKTSAPVHCLLVSGHDHFTVLGPANRVIASKIVQDTGPTCNLSLTAAEIK